MRQGFCITGPGIVQGQEWLFPTFSAVFFFGASRMHSDTQSLLFDSLSLSLCLPPTLLLVHSHSVLDWCRVHSTLKGSATGERDVRYCDQSCACVCDSDVSPSLSCDRLLGHVIKIS